MRNINVMLTPLIPLSMRKLIALLLLLPLVVGCSSGPIVKAQLDAEVKRLCAIDGGIKVYETVPLTKDIVDWAGRIWIPDKAQAKTSDPYYYETVIYYYRKGNPEMARSQHRIIRRSDGKVLGELVRYGRGGGDLPGPWHGSSFMCPDPTQQPQLESLIFVKDDKK
jgi:hypothetical protein